MNLLDQYIDYLEQENRNGGIYVWGAQGKRGRAITDSWIRGRETSEANALRAIKLKNKRIADGYGDIMGAFDCSGLGMYWLQNVMGLYKSDMSANTMMGKCKKITKADLKRGDWVFRIYTSGESKGKAYHIGYVVDDQLNVIEAKGRDDGVIKRGLTANGSGYWNAYGRPDIFAAYINAQPESKPAESYFATCTGQGVNVRMGPGTGFESMGKADQGAKLLAGPENNKWHLVSVDIGGQRLSGYMHGDYVVEV